MLDSPNLWESSHSRVKRKAEASCIHVNGMLLLCGALQRIVMFSKASPIRKQELTQMG